MGVRSLFAIRPNYHMPRMPGEGGPSGDVAGTAPAPFAVGSATGRPSPRKARNVQPLIVMAIPHDPLRPAPGPADGRPAANVFDRSGQCGTRPTPVRDDR